MRDVESVRAVVRCDEILRLHGCEYPKGAENVRCPIPDHEDSTPSFSVFDDGKRFKCHGCGESGDVFTLEQILSRCDFPEALSKLARHANLDVVPVSKDTRHQWLQTWDEAEPDDGRVARYLMSRGLSADTVKDVAGSFRLHKKLSYYEKKKCEGHYPAMVVPVVDATGQQVAIHRTWLQPDGSGKADVTTPKKMQGKFSAGAIYIGKCNGPSVGIGEGIETCMAVYEDTGIPMIAAGSATHIAKVTLPREATNILIFADADEAGRKGAESAAKRFCSEGKPVCILTPQTDSDWLDVLNEQGPDSIVKAVEIAEPWIATIDQRSNTSAANGQQGGRQPFDIAAVADEYADSRRDSESRILTRYYRQQWFVYDDIYHPAQFDDVKGSVMSWLRQHYPERANRNCQSNIVENLKATNLAGIESNASFPSWLSDGSDAGDMLVLQNYAVNIPALARNEPGAVSDPTPDLFTTNVADYRYDPTATCPRWQSFITDVQPSIKGQETLQMLAGLLLILDTSYNVFFILQGIPGSGKSVFLHVLRHLVGEQNVCCVPLTKFTDRFTSWMLADYRLNIVGDMPTVSDYGRSLHEIEGMLKDATDGGLIPYEHKHRDPQNDRTAIARNVFSTNSLPHFFDRSNGIWDRLRIIPFEQRFRGTENENPQLRHELLDELPGIFNWAVEGLWQLQQHRQFPEHPDGLSTKDAHRNSCDPERLFLEEEYRKGLDDDWEKAGDVYAAYTNWCESNGRRGKQSEANFAASVQRVSGITKERIRFRGERLRVYKGLRKND